MEMTPRPENLVAFVLAGREVRVAEVIRAAHFLGEVQAAWIALLEKIACEDLASSRDMEIDADALQERANQFRYERDLITAEQMERWLALRGLDETDFSAYLTRSHWRDTLERESAGEPEDFFTAPPDQRALLTDELILTGAFDQLARVFGCRLAALGARVATGPESAKGIAAERDRFFERTGLMPENLATWLKQVGGDEAWFEEMLAAEAAYGEQCAAILTPERLAQALRSQRLALMRFEVEEMEFDSLAAAREAVLCVTGDGLSLEEVARDSRYPHAFRDFFAEDLPEALQTLFLSTPEGGLAGPLGEEGLFHLFRLNRKVEATIDDEAIRDRLERRIFETHFAELANQQDLKQPWAEPME